MRTLPIVLLVVLALPAGATTASLPAVDRESAGHTQATPTDQPNATVTPTLARASGGLYGSLSSVDALRSAREDGTVVPVSSGEHTDRGLVPGDVLVVRLESARLAETLRSRAEDTPTERFLGYLNGTDARLRVAQTLDTTPPEVERKQLLVNQSRVRVLAEGDRRWVLVDTGNATLQYGHDRDDDHFEASLEAGEAYGVWFEFDARDDRPEPEDRPRVRVVERAVEFDPGEGRDRLYLSPANVSVPVRSTLAPGSEVTVRASVSNRTVERTVVLRGENVTRGAATFDLSGLPEGTTVPLELRQGGGVVATTTAVVDVPHATLELEPRDPWNRYVTVSGELSRGGVVALESADGRVRYDSATVDPGNVTELMLAVSARQVPNRTEFAVVAYRHVDGDGAPGPGDVPYETNGSAVRTTGVFDPAAAPTGTPTETTTTSPTVTASPPSASPSTPHGTTPGGVSATGQPGFGPVAVSLAVVALALLARRR